MKTEGSLRLFSPEHLHPIIDHSNGYPKSATFRHAELIALLNQCTVGLPQFTEADMTVDGDSTTCSLGDHVNYLMHMATFAIDGENVDRAKAEAIGFGICRGDLEVSCCGGPTPLPQIRQITLIGFSDRNQAIKALRQVMPESLAEIAAKVAHLPIVLEYDSQERAQEVLQLLRLHSCDVTETVLDQPTQQ